MCARARTSRVVFVRMKNEIFISEVIRFSFGDIYFKWAPHSGLRNSLSFFLFYLSLSLYIYLYNVPCRSARFESANAHRSENLKSSTGEASAPISRTYEKYIYVHIWTCTVWFENCDQSAPSCLDRGKEFDSKSNVQNSKSKTTSPYHSSYERFQSKLILLYCYNSNIFMHSIYNCYWIDNLCIDSLKV